MDGTVVYLCIGSNLGDRKKNCSLAVCKLASAGDIRIEERSDLYQTAPVGGPEQPDYINGVIKARTGLSPVELLEKVKRIEKDMGRTPSGRDHPRIIDIDIIFYGKQIIDKPRLKVPHPRMHERDFVLRGLDQIAPGFRHPVLKSTVRQLYSRKSSNKEKKDDPDKRC